VEVEGLGQQIVGRYASNKSDFRKVVEMALEDEALKELFR